MILAFGKPQNKLDSQESWPWFKTVTALFWVNLTNTVALYLLWFYDGKSRSRYYVIKPNYLTFQLVESHSTRLTPTMTWLWSTTATTAQGVTFRGWRPSTLPWTPASGSRSAAAPSSPLDLFFQVHSPFLLHHFLSFHTPLLIPFVLSFVRLFQVLYFYMHAFCSHLVIIYSLNLRIIFSPP